ncbi:MAG: cell division protein FtsZ, partial [Methanosarcinaceae archaeon]
QLIAETVKGITETITQPSLINLDYADIRSIMGCGGVAVMLVGESKNQDKSTDVVRAALNHPLLDVDYKGATGSLVHITGGPDLSLKEAEEVAASLTYELSPNANVIWGARVRDDYEGKIRVMAIMTGVQSAQVLGPQYEANIVEKTNTASRSYTRMERERSVVEPISAGSSGHGGSIIDIIN